MSSIPINGAVVTRQRVILSLMQSDDATFALWCNGSSLSTSNAKCSGGQKARLGQHDGR